MRRRRCGEDGAIFDLLDTQWFTALIGPPSVRALEVVPAFDCSAVYSTNAPQTSRAVQGKVRVIHSHARPRTPSGHRRHAEPEALTTTHRAAVASYTQSRCVSRECAAVVYCLTPHARRPAHVCASHPQPRPSSIAALPPPAPTKTPSITPRTEWFTHTHAHEHTHTHARRRAPSTL